MSGAQYCATFDTSADGWPTANTDHYFENYDSYLGGTYRMGERTASTVTALAPIQTADISSNFSVQIDVDAYIGTQSAPQSEIGIVCWQHDASNGSGTSAFLFFVGTSTADIDLWDNGDGSDHTLASKPISGLLQTGAAKNHLTAQCIQGTDPQSQGSQAQLSLSINGTPAVSVAYDKSTKNYDWSTGTSKSGLGVLVAGAGSDVFYKNFAVTSKCQPSDGIPCFSSDSSTTTG